MVDLSLVTQQHEQAVTALAKGDYARAGTTFGSAAHNVALIAQQTANSTLRSELLDLAERQLTLVVISTQLAEATQDAPKREITRSTNDGEDVEGGRDWRSPIVSDLRLSDVVGLDDVKAILHEMVIGPLQDPLVSKYYAEQPGGGILLYGPPGTGKTLLARAVAGELGFPFYDVNVADILSQFVGVAEKNMRNLMRQAKAQPRAIVFIDELDALLMKRGSRSSVANRVTNTFLQELSDVRNVLLIIGATNRPDSLDGASIRSFRLEEHVYVGLPDETTRLGILELETRTVPLANDVDLVSLALNSDGFSSADVARLARLARRHAASRERARRVKFGLVGTAQVSGEVTNDDFSRALKRVNPVVAPEIEQSIKRFESRLAKG